VAFQTSVLAKSSSYCRKILRQSRARVKLFNHQRNWLDVRLITSDGAQRRVRFLKERFTLGLPSSYCAVSENRKCLERTKKRPCPYSIVS
jgi:hypothetical protein